MERKSQSAQQQKLIDQIGGAFVASHLLWGGYGEVVILKPYLTPQTTFEANTRCLFWRMQKRLKLNRYGEGRMKGFSWTPLEVKIIFIISLTITLIGTYI